MCGYGCGWGKFVTPCSAGVRSTPLLVTSANEVMLSSALVCLVVSRITQKKTTEPIFTKFGEKVAHGSRKKPLDFRGNPDHVTLALGYGVSRILHWGRLKGQRPRAGVRFLGRGINPSPPARVQGRAVRSPAEFERSPDRPKVFHYFQHSGSPLLTL